MREKGGGGRNGGEDHNKGSWERGRGLVGDIEKVKEEDMGGGGVEGNEMQGRKKAGGEQKEKQGMKGAKG